MDTRGDGPPRSSDESLGSVFAALAANTAIAIAKGTAAALTGSPALLAETLHTVADAGNEVLLYVAIRRSRHPADATHPFGYGPERYYWALLAAIGMFLVGGAVSIWNGIRALVHPPELEAFWVGVAVLVVAIVLDGIEPRRRTARAARAGRAARGCRSASCCARARTRRWSRSTSRTRSTCSAPCWRSIALVLHRRDRIGRRRRAGLDRHRLLLCFIASRLTRPQPPAADQPVGARALRRALRDAPGERGRDRTP